MSKRNLPQNLKTEAAKELGFYESASSNDFGSLLSRNCGKMVQKAIEIANNRQNNTTQNKG